MVDITYVVDSIFIGPQLKKIRKYILLCLKNMSTYIF